MNVKIFYTKFTRDNRTAILHKWLSFLPFNLQKINNQLYNEEDKVRNLLGKLLLVEALQSFGYDSISIENMKYNQFKKPYLSQEFDFSISHSGSYVVCSMGKNVNLGIDIEEIKPINFLEMTPIMNDSEWKNIEQSENPLKEFFRFWTLKEAAIKAEGSGFFADLDKIIIKEPVIQLENKTWFSQELKFDENYSGHIVTSDVQSHFEVIYKGFI
ncbi:4'-phosphopantetheinyl transferase [Chryseobacterium sp. 52]|uniref:4'-phosphopantetheinyl transferase family protein n=1 Tax=Chryseobacterium sp. 52 TaxID=2035213 RepID=UPI000C18CBBA|nr:4'-phosphopantetheinyl transferase superfamily protein [Chryseobacterium sp. 52]PIF46131.1 4'-phosphopantetheinyl transferase [Chryseobacterium sp. 52]